MGKAMQKKVVIHPLSVIFTAMVIASRGENPSVAKVRNELAETLGIKVSSKTIAEILRR